MQSSDSGLDPTFLAKGSSIKTARPVFPSQPWTTSDVLRGYSSKLRVRNQVSPPFEPSSSAASFCDFN